MNEVDVAAAENQITAFVLCGGLGTRLRPVLRPPQSTKAVVSARGCARC